MSASDSTARPAPLVTIALDTPTGHLMYDEDGDPIGEITVLDRIVDAAVGRLLHEVKPRLLKAVEDAVAAEIHDQAVALVSEAIQQPFKKSSHWGGEGPEVTVRTIIGEQVEAWLKKNHNADRYSTSPFQKLLQEQVDRALSAELSGHIKEAKKVIDERVKAAASEVITETIRRAIR